MRLDQHLVAAGLAESRARAQRLIADGAVTVDGTVCCRPAQPVRPGMVVAIAAGTMPWVSRAALKLVHALDVFGLSPSSMVAYDLGASTGGFTEVLLARGAARVVAIDVGHGQLHPRLAHDPRVTAVEGVNVRTLPQGLPADLPAPMVLTADLSFIGLAKALPAAMALAAPGAVLVALIKPQFEAGPAAIGRGGIVKDPAVHAAVRADVRAFLEGAGWVVIGEAESPIAGGDGNREFLIAARAPST